MNSRSYSHAFHYNSACMYYRSGFCVWVSMYLTERTICHSCRFFSYRFWQCIAQLRTIDRHHTNDTEECFRFTRRVSRDKSSRIELKCDCSHHIVHPLSMSSGSKLTLAPIQVESTWFVWVCPGHHLVQSTRFDLIFVSVTSIIYEWISSIRPDLHEYTYYHSETMIWIQTVATLFTQMIFKINQLNSTWFLGSYLIVLLLISTRVDLIHHVQTYIDSRYIEYQLDSIWFITIISVIVFAFPYWSRLYPRTHSTRVELNYIS
jgi:hypothetical protein